MLVDVVNVILDLDRKFGLRVERLRLGSRGEWLVHDPVARFFCKTNGQVTYEGISKLNASKPRSFGEFEFFDPRALYDYVLMPARVTRIDVRTETIETKMDKLLQSDSKKINCQGTGITLFRMTFLLLVDAGSHCQYFRMVKEQLSNDESRQKEFVSKIARLGTAIIKYKKDRDTAKLSFDEVVRLKEEVLNDGRILRLPEDIIIQMVYDVTKKL